MTTTAQAKSTARQAEGSKPVELLARLGLASRGLVYLVIGLLAGQVAFGQGGQADRNGALGTLRDQPFGKGLLVVLAVGFTGYAAWRLLEAAVGHRDAEGAKRAGKRLGSLGKGVLYGSFAVSTIRFVGSSSGGSGDRTKPLTARAMGMTGGQLLVGAVGVAVVAAGLWTAYRGLSRKFLDKLDLPAGSWLTRDLAGRLGLVGLLGRGLVLCLLGGFLVEAAVTFDPGKAKGLDAGLKTLAQQPFGTVLLLAAALGLLAFGLWSFVEARYRRV